VTVYPVPPLADDFSGTTPGLFSEISGGTRLKTEIGVWSETSWDGKVYTLSAWFDTTKESSP